MIKAIFMDIDDTIFDFSLCVRGAFWEACAAAKITAVEETYQAFCRIDAALWDMQKAGRLTVDDVVRVRASRFTEAVNASTQAAAFQQAFQRALSAQTVFVQNASSVIRSLSGRFPLYAASNGMLDMQLSRLKSAELLLYFSDVFVSDEIGFEKPDGRFFTECLNRVHFRPEEVLMVGDSLQSDIVGAAKTGLKSCWLNTAKRPNPSGMVPDYEIRELPELLTLHMDDE